MVGSYIISVKRQYPKGEPFSISKLLKQLATSIWALAAILIVVQTASLICFSCGAAGAGDGRFLLTVCVYLRHGALGDFTAAALALCGAAAAAVWLATGDRHKPLPLSLPLGIAALMQIR